MSFPQFSAMYSHTRRLALAKKLLCYNKKNIILYIYNSAYVICLICCNHQKSDVMPSSFVFLFFAFCHHASVPAALFQKPQLLFLPSRLFPHILQRLCVQDFCKKQALTLSIFPAVPFSDLRELQDVRLFGRSVGENAQETLLESFLEKSRKGVLL